MGFNPRARAGRGMRRPSNLTSILAVSIHAPARGAASGWRSHLYAGVGFNPRARAGRGFVFPYMTVKRIVSIHAPARGAAVSSANRPGTGTRFNPRARAGRGFSLIETQKPPCRFNPRARAGRGLNQRLNNFVASMFQSTRPRGARLSVVSFVRLPARVSIHAPARGAARCSY